MFPSVEKNRNNSVSVCVFMWANDFTLLVKFTTVKINNNFCYWKKRETYTTLYY